MTTESKLAKRLPGVRINIIAAMNADTYEIVATEGSHKYRMKTSGLELLQDELGTINRFVKQFEESKCQGQTTDQTQSTESPCEAT